MLSSHVFTLGFIRCPWSIPTFVFAFLVRRREVSIVVQSVGAGEDFLGRGKGRLRACKTCQAGCVCNFDYFFIPLMLARCCGAGICRFLSRFLCVRCNLSLRTVAVLYIFCIARKCWHFRLTKAVVLCSVSVVFFAAGAGGYCERFFCGYPGRQTRTRLQ